MKTAFFLSGFLLLATSTFSQVQTFNVYLIGVAGSGWPFKKTAVLNELKTMLDNDPNSAVIFMGDNIYPNGMIYKFKSSKRIDAQLNVLQNYGGYAYIIPGNHDWDHHGKKLGRAAKNVYNKSQKETPGERIITNQEAYVDNYANTQLQNLKNFQQGIFYPNDASPGPVFKVLSAPLELGLILFDTQWYLNDGSNFFEPTLQDKNKFFDRISHVFDSVSQTNAFKNIIVVGHHPVYSVGSHNSDGSIQDIKNPLNKELMSHIRKTMEKYPNINFIYASGHEHLLEYFYSPVYTKNVSYIVSGSTGQWSSGIKDTEGTDLKPLKALDEIGFFTLTYNSTSSPSIQIVHRKGIFGEFENTPLSPFIQN